MSNNNYKATYLAILVAMALTACSGSHDNDTPEEIALQDRYVLGSPDSVPEGVAFDPVERDFYASSLQGASIVRIDANGNESIFRPADNRAQLGGMKVDAEARRLWVCASNVDNIDGRVWVFDLATGELSIEFLLAALASGGTCNDLALDSEGIAYVTDPTNPNIYRLDPTTELGSLFVTDPLLADSLNLGLGNNGIALTPDESALIVAKFVPQELIRVSLPVPSNVSAITLSGDALPNPDGVVFLNDDLYSVSNSQVSRVQFEADYSTGSVINSTQIDGLSTATVAEGGLYVIKSEVTRFVTEQPLQLPFEIFRVDLGDFE